MLHMYAANKKAAEAKNENFVGGLFLFREQRAQHYKTLITHSTVRVVIFA